MPEFLIMDQLPSRALRRSLDVLCVWQKHARCTTTPFTPSGQSRVPGPPCQKGHLAGIWPVESGGSNIFLTIRCPMVLRLSLLIIGLYIKDPVESSLECLGLVSSQDKRSCDPKTNTEDASYCLDCQCRQRPKWEIKLWIRVCIFSRYTKLTQYCKTTILQFRKQNCGCISPLRFWLLVTIAGINSLIGPTGVLSYGSL